MNSEKETLVRDFQRGRVQLIAYIRSLVGDPDLTEDLFQEVSVIVLQKAGDFETGKDLQAWCRGIARNLVLREREKARRLRTFEDDRLVALVDAAFAEHDDRDATASQRSMLSQCLELLAAAPREMVGLRYGSNLSLREISERLKRSEAAVQVALSRIRRWLFECIQRRAQAGAEAEP